MGQVRHWSATTTHVVIAEMQRSQALLTQLSKEMSRSSLGRYIRKNLADLWTLCAWINGLSKPPDRVVLGELKTPDAPSSSSRFH